MCAQTSKQVIAEQIIFGKRICFELCAPVPLLSVRLHLSLHRLGINRNNIIHFVLPYLLWMSLREGVYCVLRLSTVKRHKFVSTNEVSLLHAFQLQWRYNWFTMCSAGNTKATLRQH